jgi:uncharacterized cofD-like protein
VGEHEIDVCAPEYAAERISRLELKPKPRAQVKAVTAILEADLIVLGPGDIYTSILANCVVPGIAEAIKQSPAPLLYVCNLMSRLGQTIGMHSCDYLDEIEAYVGRRPTQMICNETDFDAVLLKKYQTEGNHPVLNTAVEDSCHVRLLDVVSTESYVTKTGDSIERSLIRHDAKKLAEAVVGSAGFLSQ